VLFVLVVNSDTKSFKRKAVLKTATSQLTLFSLLSVKRCSPLRSYFSRPVPCCRAARTVPQRFAACNRTQGPCLHRVQRRLDGLIPEGRTRACPRLVAGLNAASGCRGKDRKACVGTLSRGRASSLARQERPRGRPSRRRQSPITTISHASTEDAPKGAIQSRKQTERITETEGSVTLRACFTRESPWFDSRAPMALLSDLRRSERDGEPRGQRNGECKVGRRTSGTKRSSVVHLDGLRRAPEEGRSLRLTSRCTTNAGAIPARAKALGPEALARAIRPRRRRAVHARRSPPGVSDRREPGSAEKEREPKRVHQLIVPATERARE
jgi:hypothetical protein